MLLIYRLFAEIHFAEIHFYHQEKNNNRHEKHKSAIRSGDEKTNQLMEMCSIWWGVFSTQGFFSTLLFIHFSFVVDLFFLYFKTKFQMHLVD